MEPGSYSCAGVVCYRRHCTQLMLMVRDLLLCQRPTLLVRWEALIGVPIPYNKPNSMTVPYRRLRHLRFCARGPAHLTGSDRKNSCILYKFASPIHAYMERAESERREKPG